MKKFMVVQHTYAEFLGPIEKQLESRDIGFLYQRPFLGVDLPGTASQHDALWLLGGAYPITDTDACPWVDDEMRLINNFKRMKRPIVGIGFGALMIAQFEGGIASDEPYFNAYFTTCHKTEAGRDDPLANAVDGKKMFVMYNGSATLPAGPRGNSSTTIRWLGTFSRARCARAYASTSFDVTPAAASSTTQLTTRSAKVASATPTVTASSTPGMRTSVRDTSSGYTLTPPVTITFFFRPVIA